MGLLNRKKGRKRQGNRKTRNLLAILLLVLFPPVGVVLLWRSSFSGTAKYCLTGVAVALLAVGVAMLPSADHRVNGGIELVGVERQAEIYGPELPTAMVTGYTVSLNTDSVFAEDDGAEVEYVYAAKDAKCYHTYECKFAFASSQRLTVYEAHYLGYEPCGRCNPPVYEP